MSHAEFIHSENANLNDLLTLRHVNSWYLWVQGEGLCETEGVGVVLVELSKFLALFKKKISAFSILDRCFHAG